MDHDVVNSMIALESSWLAKEEVSNVKWLPTDLGLIDRIREQMH